MQTAKDLMISEVISVSPLTPAQVAVDRLVDHNLSGIPVIDDTGRIVGIFSEVDRILQGSLDGFMVQGLMSKDVVAIDVNESWADVARTFKESLVRRLPVTENGVMVGIIGLRDMIRYIRETERTLEMIAPVVRDCERIDSECWCNAD